MTFMKSILSFRRHVGKSIPPLQMIEFNTDFTIDILEHLVGPTNSSTKFVLFWARNFWLKNLINFSQKIFIWKRIRATSNLWPNDLVHSIPRTSKCKWDPALDTFYENFVTQNWVLDVHSKSWYPLCDLKNPKIGLFNKIQNTNMVTEMYFRCWIYWWHLWKVFFRFEDM